MIAFCVVELCYAQQRGGDYVHIKKHYSKAPVFKLQMSSSISSVEEGGSTSDEQYSSRKLEWSEINSEIGGKEEDEFDTVQDRMKKNISSELGLCVLQHFKLLESSLSEMYRILHNTTKKIVTSARSDDFTDGLDETRGGDFDLDNSIREILNPSFLHLQRVYNLEMVRLSHELSN